MTHPSTESSEQTTYGEILAIQITRGQQELDRRSDGLLLSALAAGLDMGFGPLLMGVMLTIASSVYAQPLTDILLANLYAIGFILIVLGRSELFTEHTALAVFPVLAGRESLRDLGRVWGLVFIGNVVGSAIFARFVVSFAPSHLVDPAAFTALATTYTTQSAWPLFAGALLAGWLMGLLTWLVAAAQDTLGRVFFVWLITASISFAHFPHCIAGTVEVLMGLFISPAITPLDYGRFLLFTTVGNAIGGTIFVAVLRYSHVVRSDEDPVQ